MSLRLWTGTRRRTLTIWALAYNGAVLLLSPEHVILASPIETVPHQSLRKPGQGTDKVTCICRWPPAGMTRRCGYGSSTGVASRARDPQRRCPAAGPQTAVNGLSSNAAQLLQIKFMSSFKCAAKGCVCSDCHAVMAISVGVNAKQSSSHTIRPETITGSIRPQVQCAASLSLQASMAGHAREEVAPPRTPHLRTPAGAAGRRLVSPLTAPPTTAPRMATAPMAMPAAAAAGADAAAGPTAAPATGPPVQRLITAFLRSPPPPPESPAAKRRRTNADEDKAQPAAATADAQQAAPAAAGSQATAAHVTASSGPGMSGASGGVRRPAIGVSAAVRRLSARAAAAAAAARSPPLEGTVQRLGRQHAAGTAQPSSARPGSTAEDPIEATPPEASDPIEDASLSAEPRDGGGDAACAMEVDSDAAGEASSHQAGSQVADGADGAVPTTHPPEGEDADAETAAADAAAAADVVRCTQQTGLECGECSVDSEETPQPGPHALDTRSSCAPPPSAAARALNALQAHAQWRAAAQAALAARAGRGEGDGGDAAQPDALAAGQTAAAGAAASALDAAGVAAAEAAAVSQAGGWRPPADESMGDFNPTAHAQAVVAAGSLAVAGTAGAQAVPSAAAAAAMPPAVAMPAALRTFGSQLASPPVAPLADAQPQPASQPQPVSQQRSQSQGGTLSPAPGAEHTVDSSSFASQKENDATVGRQENLPLGSPGRPPPRRPAERCFNGVSLSMGTPSHSSAPAAPA